MPLTLSACGRPAAKSKEVEPVSAMYMAGMDMIRANPKTRTGRLTLKLAARRKYPGLSTLLFRDLAAYASNLLPDVGQNILSPAIRMSDGISVRLTIRAIRTPKPRPTPIDRRSVKLVNVIAPKAIITVVALVAMLSPDQVMDVWTACALS